MYGDSLFPMKNVVYKYILCKFDGTPDALKGACPVWTGGKAGDYFKGLPIGIARSRLRGGIISDSLVKILLSYGIYGSAAEFCN